MEPYKEPRGTGGWLTLVLGALVFAVFGGVVGYAYVNGLPGMGGEPPLIRADAEPYRHAPSERGGLEVANSSSSIVNVLRPQSEPARVERLLPPETPMAVETPEPDESPVAAPAPPPRAIAAAPVVEPTPAPPPTAAPAPAPPPPAATAPREPPAAAPPSATAAGTPTEETPPAVAGAAPVPAVKPEAPRQLAAVEPPAGIAAQPRRPVPTQAAPAAERPAQRASPAPQRPAPQASPTAPAAPAPQRQARAEPRASAASVVGDIYRLQLVAVRTDAGLTQAWAQLRQRYPQALASVDPRIERTDTTSGPLYRLQAGPYRTREDAADACGNIRAGGGQCFIVGPVPQ
jgi:hypothetical protein